MLRPGLRRATEPVCVLAGPSSEGDPGSQGLPREPRKPLCSKRVRQFAGETESNSKVPQCNQIRYRPHSADTGQAATSTTPPTAAHPLVTTHTGNRTTSDKTYRRGSADSATEPPCVLGSSSNRQTILRRRPGHAVPDQSNRSRLDIAGASRRSREITHHRFTPRVPMVTPDHTSQRRDARSHAAATSQHNPISHQRAHMSIRSANHATTTAPLPPNRGVGWTPSPRRHEHTAETATSHGCYANAMVLVGRCRWTAQVDGGMP
jgi:hypothetical protein